MLSLNVARGHVHATCFAYPIHLCSNVSIYCNTEGITSACRHLAVETMSSTFALGHVLMSWCWADFWIWSDAVITHTCQLITTAVLIRHLDIRHDDDAVSGNGFRHGNKVKLRWARLVPGLVTAIGGSTIPIFFRPRRPTQPGHPTVDNCSEYWR